MAQRKSWPSQRRHQFKVHAKKAGLSPGTLIHVGDRKMAQPLLSFFDYDAERLNVATDVNLEDCLTLRDTASVSWINLDGIHDIQLLEKFGQVFNLHPLALEDILNTQHRPKIEEFEGYNLVILKMLSFNPEESRIEAEQISLVLGPRYVLSFQERSGDVFDGLRERLRRSNGRIRQRGADYLLYGMLDSIVDSYFQILEQMGDQLAELEESLTRDPDEECLYRIQHFKRELVTLRKSVWPLREVINELQRGEVPMIEDSTAVFLRDLYDHTIQVLDTVEIFRDTVSGMLDIYLSSVSNRMNEVMKVLTIMATIFIPLTFIAGIYGMNFAYMPELQWRYGYAMVWGVMILCLAGMFWFFRRRRWL